MIAEYTPDLFADRPQIERQSAPTTSSEGDAAAGYWVPCGNIFMAEWREYDEALFAAIIRL